MERVRYFIAVWMFLSIPSAIGLWVAIHPFARAWRRIGPAATYAVLMIPTFGLSWFLWQARDTLVGTDFGPRPALLAVGALAAVGGTVIARARRRHLTQRILVGVPELSSSDKGRLLTEGIYAKVRNPRYIEFLFFVLAAAGVVNFSGTWALVVLCVPALHVVVLLEEAELRDRFGAEYDDYCRRVPRWLPTALHLG
jgi:protein-S-isoprenylcysteine O-methyltransferase Ste14